MSEARGSTNLIWSQALDAMELGHNLATPKLKKLGYHLRARGHELDVIDLIQTATQEIIVAEYQPTPADRVNSWEIIR